MAEYIKREDVLELAKRGFIVGNRNYSSVVAFVNDVPSADVVERKAGTWGKENECSECGCQPWFYHDIHTLNFCPNCGARMVPEDDEA